MSEAARSTMRRDIVSAYVVTISRIGSWALISALVYRKLGVQALALLAVVRATIGLLNYTSLGLGPAMVRMLSAASATPQAAIPVEETVSQESAAPVIGYAHAPQAPAPDENVIRIYVTGERTAIVLGLIGVVLAFIYATTFTKWYESDQSENEARTVAFMFGLGTVFRLISEAPSGLLLARGRISLDNTFLAATELGWAAACAVSLTATNEMGAIAAWFMAANLMLLIVRSVVGRIEARQLTSAEGSPDWRTARRLLSMGSLIVLASLADFLYAPTDCVLITQLIDVTAVAWYSPAMQIDAGLLLLVTALATVLFPKTAIAHSAGDIATIRRYYIHGTVVSGAILLLAGIVVWAISPYLFKFWFGDDLPMTRAILPLMLIHTVVGGSSGVGRSILLGMGKFKAFTISVLIAGVSNVILSFVFVKYFHLGLKGIVCGTIVAVVARCAIWMPWYVMKQLRNESKALLNVPLDPMAE